MLRSKKGTLVGVPFCFACDVGTSEECSALLCYEGHSIEMWEMAKPDGYVTQL